jgi:hypothetical protein
MKDFKGGMQAIKILGTSDIEEARNVYQICIGELPL